MPNPPLQDRYLRPRNPALAEAMGAALSALRLAMSAGDAEAAEAATRAWNAGACRERTPDALYRSSFSAPPKALIDQALGVVPAWHDALTFADAVEACGAAMAGVLTSRQSNFVWSFLEENLPGAKIETLVYWPDIWFGDPKLQSIQLSAEQVLGYAMAASGRELHGAPAALPLPLPMPARPSSGPILL